MYHWNSDHSRKRAKTSFKNCKANCQTVQRLLTTYWANRNKIQRILENAELQAKCEFKRNYLSSPMEIEKFIWTFWSQYLPAHLRQTSPYTDEFPMRSFMIYPKFQDLKFTSWKFRHLNLVNPFARIYQILSGIPPEDTIQIISSKPLESNQLRERGKISFKNCKVNCQTVQKLLTTCWTNRKRIWQLIEMLNSNWKIRVQKGLFQITEDLSGIPPEDKISVRYLTLRLTLPRTVPTQRIEIPM